MIFKIFNFLMLLMFLFSVAVQYNDPDPIRWMLIYGSAAACCILYLAGKLKWPLSAAVCAAAFVWALTILPHLNGQPLPPDQVFATMHMITPAVEEAREMLGLLIVAGWMLVLTLKVRRAAAVPKSRSDLSQLE